MIKRLFALKDKLAGFTDPFVDYNGPICMRHIRNSLKQETDFSLNPKDFELYEVGSFNTEDGTFTSDVKKLIDVADLIEVVDGNA